MRKIKFRGKNKKGKWVFGFYYAECGNAYIIEDRQQETLLHRNITHKVDPDTIGQYTGLTDENGREIYEGDYVNIIDPNGDQRGHGVVKYLDTFGIWYVDGGGSFSNNGLYDIQIQLECVYKIIGNIHMFVPKENEGVKNDNSELIKK